VQGSNLMKLYAWHHTPPPEWGVWLARRQNVHMPFGLISSIHTVLKWVAERGVWLAYYVHFELHFRFNSAVRDVPPKTSLLWHPPPLQLCNTILPTLNPHMHAMPWPYLQLHLASSPPPPPHQQQTSETCFAHEFTFSNSNSL
jgi:hypothetical protein